MTNTKYAVFVQNPEGQLARIFPRSRKSHLFVSEAKAIKALDDYSRRLQVNGFRGMIYATPYMPEDKPYYTMAL